MKRIVGITAAFVLSATIVAADENPILGTWKLKSFAREVRATGERYNEHLNGYLSYSSDGRMYAIIVEDNRVKPLEVVPTDDEAVKLYRTMGAYAGTYTSDSEKVIHHVDISSNEAWTGTDQVRFYKLNGNTLTITTAPNKDLVDGREGQSILVWEKVKGATQ
jgi:hypothetical protein